MRWQPLVDNRAPGVSNALRDRMTRLIWAGATPSLRGNRVVLGDVTLVFANGREAPVAAEMRRQVCSKNLDGAAYATNRFQTNSLTKRNGRLMGIDRAGREHVLLRHFRGVTRVTPAGRRYETEAPLVQWVVHIPVVHWRRMGIPFDPRTVAITDEMIRRLAPEASDIFNLRGRVNAASARRLVDFMRSWATPDNLGQFMSSRNVKERIL